MRKYLELFTNGFDETLAEKVKLENWPYVGHDVLSGEVVYTVIPTSVVGPANNEIWYTSSDGNVVTPYNTSVFGANIVSNTYTDGKGVITCDGDITSIGGGAFLECSSLTSVTIPNSVTSIGYGAFRRCFSLTSVTIPNSVTSIGEEAFNYCSLSSITIPNSVTSIGGGAFMGCSSLTSIVVESGNTTYDSRENCNAIIETATNTLIAGCQNTIIPNSVTNIGGGAFLEYSSLTSITIPNSVTSIGNQAFYWCSSLSSITFKGTMEEWSAITKGSSWNNNVPATYIQCSDGQVAL